MPRISKFGCEVGKFETKGNEWNLRGFRPLQPMKSCRVGWLLLLWEHHFRRSWASVSSCSHLQMDPSRHLLSQRRRRNWKSLEPKRRYVRWLLEAGKGPSVQIYAVQRKQSLAEYRVTIHRDPRYPMSHRNTLIFYCKHLFSKLALDPWLGQDSGDDPVIQGKLLRVKSGM